jgi:multidrug efflux pump subunit AcrB
VKFIEFVVRRYQLTLVIFVALAALGAVALKRIPKAEDPSFPIATFVIVAVLPGASPGDMERLVVDPVERSLKALDDVKKLSSSIEEGLGLTTLEFRAGVDADRKHDEVQRELAAVRPELPRELVRLEVRQVNAAKTNVAQLALVSSHPSWEEMDAQARRLQRILEAVPGVSKATLAGLPRMEVQVAVDLERAVALGVSPGEVIQALSEEGVSIPAGNVEAGGRRFGVRTSGDFASLDEISSTMLRGDGQQSLRVRDVATVQLVPEEREHVVRFQGEPAVSIAVAQREGQNLLEVREALGKAVDEFRRGLPPGMRLAWSFDQSENVRHRLGGFSRDLLLAIGLVLFTLLPLGLRASGVVMVSIPLSLAIGLSLLWALGFSINQLSIVGFVIALGLLVDDSVVVVENIARFLREGEPPVAAAIKATGQIAPSVLGCTAALLLAFVPLLALPGTAGQFIRSLPVAVVVTIFASLIVSLTIVPFLASRLLRPEAEHGNRILQLLMRLIEAVYRPILSRAMRRPRLTLLLSAGLLAAGAALVPVVGFSLFPKAGIPQFLVRVRMDEGASLAATEEAVRFAEAALAARPWVGNVTSNIGKGNPQVYYNVAQQNEQASFGEILAEARVPSHDLTSVLDRLRGDLTGFPGARFEVKEFENGPPLEAPIALRLLGPDAASVEKGAALVERVFRETPGTRDVENPSKNRRLDLRVRVDRDRAAALGVRPVDVDRAVRLALGGVNAGRFRAPTADDPYSVRVVFPRDLRDPQGAGGRSSVGVLDRLYLSAGGGAVPLSAVAQLALEPAPSTLRRFDAGPSAIVTAYTVSGANTDQITKEILGRLSSVELPPGVRLKPAGEIESREESFGGIGAAVLIAAFGIMAVLVLEFRTFRGTLIVASVVPFGAVGGIVALYLAGYTLSFTASIGFVALMGIEIKNSILLVDFTNHLREQGMALDEAIQKAGETRFLPVVLTSATAIGGLMPLALERSALYSPLAVVLLGGLVASTLLARLVTPVLYKLLPPEIEPAEGAAPAVSLAIGGAHG